MERCMEGRGCPKAGAGRGGRNMSHKWAGAPEGAVWLRMGLGGDDQELGKKAQALERIPASRSSVAPLLGDPMILSSVPCNWPGVWVGGGGLQCLGFP